MMTDKFEVKSLEKAMKPGYVVANIQYPSGKIYNFVRKAYESHGTFSIVIQGYRISYHFFMNQYIVDNVEKEYDTAGKKVTDTSKEGSPIIKKESPAPEVEFEFDPDKEVFHSKFPMIKACVEMGIPVYLHGPAGSGKNHVLEQVAKQMDLNFYFTNSIQQEYKITGFIDAGGTFHETEFYKAFKDGGLFFLDELDASIPEVLVLLNAAIANGYFEFPNGKITANENFRVVAAGNTCGSGADEAYTGRLVLDQATLDRFSFIEFGYDKQIELQIAKGDNDLVSFVHELRKVSETQGIRTTFSYRCISMVSSLKDKLSLEDILKIAVFKGMDSDTIKTFNVSGYSKYHKAFNSLKKGYEAA